MMPSSIAAELIFIIIIIIIVIIVVVVTIIVVVVMIVTAGLTLSSNDLVCNYVNCGVCGKRASVTESCQGTVSAHMTRVGRIGTHCNKLLFQIRYLKIFPPDIFCPLDKTRCDGERFLWCRSGFTNGTGR